MHEYGFSPPVGRASEEVRRAGDLAFGRPPPGPQWPGRRPSGTEREGVPSTDTEAGTPLGVGVSESKGAEEIAREKGADRRRTAGVRGRSGRPFGSATPEETTGVDPAGPVEDDSPYLPPGD
jgi:hypothetical protein